MPAGNSRNFSYRLLFAYQPFVQCQSNRLQRLGAEHGIGLEKKPYLYVSRSANEIALMRTLKQALDPKGVLNPGKIFDPGPVVGGR
jgi:hypothetical protein